ncbi:DEAD/DEAH box helicase family protein [Lysinibacillus sp. FSL M8-0216]|uniref:DEAD/DEAH box helicase family protein n=1 Tax=Lysinibacillus sp. FSL M8-0216 TaxID=2921619 RepID=UPI003159B467
MNVTDCIQQEYLEWQRGDIITISAGTGKGKSHFIKNELYDHAKSKGKRILFFLHRTNTLEQFEAEIAAEGKDDVIELSTYQGFEKAIIRQNQLDLWMYEYIICDEYHYFGNDSSFNKFTDLSLNEIIEGADERVVVLMSATNEFIKAYLNNSKSINPKEYILSANYDYIKTLELFDDDQLIIDGLKKRVAKGEKALIFIESANDCYELFKHFEEHSMFICGKSHRNYKYVDEEKREQLLKNQRFNDLFLFTTQTLDAGVNIIDDDLHFIIVDIADPDVLVQCVGRKRIRDAESDYVHLVVKNRSNGRLGYDKGNLTNRMKHAKFFEEHSQEEYDREFYREPDPYQLVYYEPLPNGLYKIGVNQLLFDSYKYKYKRLEDIQEIAGGYRQFIVELFGKEGSVSMDAYLDPNTLTALEAGFTEGLIFYSKEEKRAFAEKLNLKVNGRIITSFRKINELLTTKEASFRIFPHEAKKDGKRYKTAWRIIQMSK